jgi:outer membrane protein
LIVKRRTIVGMYAALLAGSISVAHAEVKIGVVSIQRLYEESVQARAAKEILSREFDPRFADLQKEEKALQDRQDKLTKDAATMTEMQKSAADRELTNAVRALQAKRSAFEDDFDARKQDENARILPRRRISI